jgi:hypothetical protein
VSPHSRSKNGVASLAYSRSKNGVASLAYAHHPGTLERSIVSCSCRADRAAAVRDLSWTNDAAGNSSDSCSSIGLPGKAETLDGRPGSNS